MFPHNSLRVRMCKHLTEFKFVFALGEQPTLQPRMVVSNLEVNPNETDQLIHDGQPTPLENGNVRDDGDGDGGSKNSVVFRI